LIASELISKTIAPLNTSDSGEQALTMMNIYHVKHLPVVNNVQLLGTISEDDILNNNLEEAIGSYELSLVKAYANHKDHMFEVLSAMAEQHLSVIPIIDDNEDYLGLITQGDLIQFYANSFSFTEPGSILILETTQIDYSLAEVARIVESENCSILTSFLTHDTDSEDVFLTLKINKQDIQQLISTLKRYEYKIKASFAEAEYIDGLKDRYDALMHYLSV
jgi:CBS domain-containing protein